MKKIKGKTKTDVKFFIKFLIALLIVFGYYLANYLSYLSTITVALNFNTELNNTCVTEPFYWFALNTQRELFWDPTKVVMNNDSFMISKASVTQMYD